MSVVTGVMVICCCAEPESNPDSDYPLSVDALDQWLNQKGYGPLVLCSEHLGGTKHPQFLSFGAGYNYFPQGAFAEFFASLEWDFPENAVLIMQPETGSTIIVHADEQRNI